MSHRGHAHAHGGGSSGSGAHDATGGTSRVVMMILASFIAISFYIVTIRPLPPAPTISWTAVTPPHAHDDDHEHAHDHHTIVTMKEVPVAPSDDSDAMENDESEPPMKGGVGTSPSSHAHSSSSSDSRDLDVDSYETPAEKLRKREAEAVAVAEAAVAKAAADAAAALAAQAAERVRAEAERIAAASEERRLIAEAAEKAKQCFSNCKSRVVYDIPRLDLYQGVTDEWSAVQSFHDVIMQNGVVTFYGLDQASINDMHQKVISYKHYVHNQQLYDDFNTVFRFEPGTFDWKSCTEEVDEVSFLISPWHPDNMFHLHNDNLVAMFANVQAAKALNSPKRLYLFDGDSDRNNKQLPWYMGIFKLMFNSVRPFTELKAAPRTCFRHFRWGRGPLVFYQKEIHPRDAARDPHPKIVMQYQSHILKLFGVAQRARSPKYTFPARSLHVAREAGSSRSLTNPDVVIAALAAVNITTETCCDWKKMTLPAILELFQTADIIWGMHGAGLAHSLYMPPGGVLIEFATEFGFGNINFDQSSKHLEHNYMYPDVRAFHGHSGHTVSAEWAATFAGWARDLWLKPKGEQPTQFHI